MRRRTSSASVPPSSSSASAKARRHAGFGWVPDVPDHRDHRYAAARGATLPAKVDLRAQCPPVYDQQSIGSCTANAIAAALQFDRRKQQLADFMPSRLFIYYNERAIEGTVGSDAGALIRDGIKSVSKLGDCPETLWPYDGAPFAHNARATLKPTAACYASAKTYRAVSYQRVTRTLAQIRGCLAEGFPFVFGISVYASFMSATVARTGVVPLPRAHEAGAGEGGAPAGHAMLAVGYDDAKQTFIIRNSWGASWGRQGYGTLPYAYLLDSDLSDDFWTVRLVK